MYFSCIDSPCNLYLAYTHIYKSVCITIVRILYVVYFGQSGITNHWAYPALCSTLGLTDVKSHSLTSTSKECTRLAFEGGKAENQRRPRYRFGEGRVDDKQRSKTSTVQHVRGCSQCVTLRSPTLHNYAVLPRPQFYVWRHARDFASPLFSRVR